METKEFEFNLYGYHDVVPHSICTSTLSMLGRPDPTFLIEGAAAPDYIVSCKS